MTAQSPTWWGVSEWEFNEAIHRLTKQRGLPRGRRTESVESIAADYGITSRTLYRWARYRVYTVRCGKYEALFVIGRHRPSQVTPWEKAA